LSLCFRHLTNYPQRDKINSRKRAHALEGVVKRLAIAILATGLGALSSAALADTLELKNGSVIKGTFIGGSEAHVSLRMRATLLYYPVADVAVLRFDSDGGRRAATDSGFAQRPQTNLAPTPTPAPVAATRSAPAATGDRVTVPTGTRLTVRTVDAIDSDKNHV